MTSKSAGSVGDMATQLVNRLTALGRVHSLVRPLPGNEGKAALLGDLLAVILAPYDDEGAFAGRIKISVPRMGVGDVSATALAMIIHELATNSLKYGALSATAGKLDISSNSDDHQVELVWSETGGPAIADAPTRKGFGSGILRNAVERQLGGTFAMDWQEEGLVVKIQVRREQLAK
jgi:two-component sensor histidine kinase